MGHRGFKLHPKADAELTQLWFEQRGLAGLIIETWDALAAPDGARWGFQGRGRIRGAPVFGERAELWLQYVERRDGHGVGGLAWCEPRGGDCPEGAWELARFRLDEMGPEGF